MEQLVDVGSERAVLAGIFTYGSKAFVEVNELLTNHTLTVDSNTIIWKSLKHFFETSKDGDKPDIASIYASSKAIGHDGFFDNSEEKKYLRSLMNFPVNFESIRKLAIRLRKLEVGRSLWSELALAQQSINSMTGDESISRIISFAEGPILEFATKLGEETDDSQSHIGEGLDAFVQFLIDNPRDCVGLSTGLPTFDMCIGGGLRRGSVNIIGARPKIGKTTLGINIGLNVAGGLDVPVFYFDMEMDKEDFWVKMLANLSGVEINVIERGKFDSEQLTRIQAAKETLKSTNFHYFNIAGQSFEETLAMARRVMLKKVGRNPETGKINDCLMIYDYFRLNNSENISNNIQEYQALGFQIIALKTFAKKLDIPILTFVQLNRDGIDKEDTDVASGSDRIIWLCNNFTIFKPKGEEENEEDMTHGRALAHRKLVPIVARHGGGLGQGDYINIFFQGELGRLKEGKTRNQSSKYDSGFGSGISDETGGF